MIHDEAAPPQWRKVRSKAELRVGMVVRRCADPNNKEWADAGIGKGSIGVVVDLGDEDHVGVSYFVAPTTPETYSSRSWKTYWRRLEVTDA